MPYVCQWVWRAVPADWTLNRMAGLSGRRSMQRLPVSTLVFLNHQLLMRNCHWSCDLCTNRNIKNTTFSPVHVLLGLWVLTLMWEFHKASNKIWLHKQTLGTVNSKWNMQQHIHYWFFLSETRAFILILQCTKRKKIRRQKPLSVLVSLLRT